MQLAVHANPFGELLFRYFAAGKTNHGLNFVYSLCQQPKTIEAQEKCYCDERDPLVPVNECVILR